MKASQLLRRILKQGEIHIEIVIWALPKITSDRPHSLKYRLYCGHYGKCVVRYDNESGKGDHRHYGDKEEAYLFVGLPELIEDFKNDCARLAGWRWEE
ncbi:MAG: hypothetical protein HY777_08520 [Betaproteobacteria bacterium]|nr:hypothetical protein [Betaproteobacteria bacterium]